MIKSKSNSFVSKLILQLTLFIFWHIVCPFIPVFSGFNNTMALYLVLSIHAVCQFYKSITIIMLSQTLKEEKPYWVNDTIYEKEYKYPFDNSLDQVYIIFFYLYAIITLINAWHLSPGFMLCQTCLAFTIEITLLEILHMRFLLVSSSIYMGHQAFANLKEEIAKEVHEKKNLYLRYTLELTIIVVTRNLVLLNHLN